MKTGNSNGVADPGAKAAFLSDPCSQLSLVTADRAIPTGLIVNELVTNAVTYAFEPGGRGTVETLLAGNEDTVRIRVRDEGRGLPEGFDLEPGRAGTLFVLSFAAASSP